MVKITKGSQGRITIIDKNKRIEKRYFPNRQQMYIQQYKNNKKHGLFCGYRENGELIYKKQY